MNVWNTLLALPRPALIVVTAFALAIVCAHAWTVYRLVRSRGEIRAALARDGFLLRELELRWLTRGPFTDMGWSGAKGNRGVYLYRVTAADRQRASRTGWIRWRARWPWQHREEWLLRWDGADEAPSKGFSSAMYVAMLIVLTLIVLSVVRVAWRHVGWSLW